MDMDSSSSNEPSFGKIEGIASDQSECEGSDSGQEADKSQSRSKTKNAAKVKEAFNKNPDLTLENV